jgi:hypothetical protein
VLYTFLSSPWAVSHAPFAFSHYPVNYELLAMNWRRRRS